MANLLKASGEITITDISDSVQLSSYISSTLQRQVIYDPNDKVYVPNFANTNNVLTPQLYITGNTEDIILQAKSVRWFYQLNSTGSKIPITANTTDYTLNTVTKQLTIKNNVLKDYNSIHYTVEIIFTDPNSMMDVVTKAEIELVKIKNGVNGSDGNNAITAVLTNETHNIPTDAEGLDGNYNRAESSLKIYEGNQEVTESWEITITPSESVQGNIVINNDSTPVGVNRNLFVFNTSTNHYMYDGVIHDADQNDRLSVPIPIPDITKPYHLTWRGGTVGSEAFMNIIYLDKDGEYLSEKITANYDIGVAPYTMSSALSFPANTKFVRVNGSQLNNGKATLKLEQGSSVTAYSPAPEDVVTTGEKIFKVNNLTSDIGTVTFTANKTGFSDITKIFTIAKVKNGQRGSDGRTPVKGTDYFDGKNGQDGSSSYLWIMYSNNSDGSGMVSSPTNAKYIGVATTQSNVKPTNNASYSWSLVKGSDGIRGETGSDGQTSYLHIKYSDDGTTFTSNNGETIGAYLGTYVDFTEADSNVFSKYSWNKVRGSDGERGIKGETGADGKTSYTHIAWANSADGTQDFSVSVSTNKLYIGMYADHTEADSTRPSDYLWTLIKGADGSQGVAGKAGTDGKTPYIHFAWANNSSGTSGFDTTISQNKLYIGTYSDHTSADSTDPTKYKWTLVKGSDGENGVDSTSYWLSGYPTAIKKNGTGIYTPLNFTVSIISQTGTANPVAYSGRFIIQETTDNSTWTTKYTSTVNESSKSFTPSAGIRAVRIKIHLAGGTTTLLDEQTVPVVEDGLDPILPVISTPKGSIIKNSVGNLEAELILYKGGQAVTGTGFKWYELDTTVAGGWRQLTSTNPDGTTGYTTSKLIVTPASIVSTNTYKGVATYNGIEYYEMVTFTDITDPISTVIVGTSIFKNGTGENTFTAIAYQNGIEIDKAGTKYLYKWSMINSSGVVNSSWTATGKTIKVLANQYVNITQLKCDLDDRK